MAAEAPDKLEDIVDPRDTDVLCGRGGAALRHPGNQTYRRLVNLNKGLYITCLKTEKLKISRSIVAAIREQKGRFLEKDAQKGTWYDIGDKKAIEKTSQALREGQPKLRQKIVEMGGGVSGTPSFMDYGNNGLYNPEQVNLSSTNLDSTSRGRPQDIQAMQPPQPMAPTRHHPGDINADMLMQRLSLSEVSGGTTSLHSLDRLSGTNSQYSLLSATPSFHSIDNRMTGSLHSLESQQQQQQRNMQQRVNRLRPSLTSRDSQHGHDMGIGDSNLSLMSEFSAYAASAGHGLGGHGPIMNGSTRGYDAAFGNNSGGNNIQLMSSESFAGIDTSFRKTLAGLSNLPASSAHTFTSNYGFDSSMHSGIESTGSSHTPIPLSAINAGYTETHISSPSGGGYGNRDKLGGIMDRRRVFAKMKYERPPSSRHQTGASQHSLTVYETDFNMVESTLTLSSNVSNMTGVEMPNGSEREMNPRPRSAYVPPKPLVETAKVVDHSRLNPFSEVLATGSRHSIMSGLSRISDTSIDQSIFSDLSRKIGNVSTRSLAMSEISAIDMQERDNEEDDDYPIDSPRRRLAAAMGITISDEAKTDPPLEFHL